MSSLASPQISRSDLAARWDKTRARLFGSPVNSAVTILASALILWIAATFLRWAVVEAAWSGGPEACKAHSGACWPFVWTNARLMFFGTYPTELLWRDGLISGVGDTSWQRRQRVAKTSCGCCAAVPSL